METNLLSVSKIFTERLFRIPDYQRGYAWTERQLKDFWNDIIQLEDDKNHYTGVLTLENVPIEKFEEWEDDLWIIKSRSYEPYYIVDGQQRLTTTIVLIQTILEEASKFGELNFTPITDIRKKFIYDSKDGGISRSYIFGYEKDNPSYNFLKTEIFKEEQDTNYTKEETVYTNNLENAKAYFKNEISGLEKGEIELVYKKLTQNLLFNIYSISSDIDVFVAFETMNNRGKPLSHLELLKNRLIYLSTKFEVDDYEKNSLRTRINNCWKAIYHNLGRNKNNPLDDDIFLLNHFLIYFGTELFLNEEDEQEHLRILPRMRRMYRDEYSNFLLEKKFTTKNLKETKSQITINEIDSYVKSLQGSVVAWYKIFNPKESDYTNDTKKWLEKLNRMGVVDVAPLIMSFFQKEKSEKRRIELLQKVEKFKFLFRMVAYRYYIEYDPSFFLKLAIELNEDKTDSHKTLKNIDEIFLKQISNRDLMMRIRKDFRNNGFYKWDGIRYFLFEYDLYLQEQSKAHRKKLIWEEFNNKDYETVEHIYPRKSRNDYWQSKFEKYTPKERRILKDSLGNLLPLSREKNSSFSNKSFPDKVGNKKDSVGFRFGCYSENEITSLNDWDAVEIYNRGLKLLNFLENRWNIKIGSEKDKIDFLNIEFVVKKEKLSLTRGHK